MKIVIDIDENVYTRLFDNGIQDIEIAVDDVCEMARALRLGTPLPKGHGRLIDANALGEELHRYTEAPYLYALKVFNEAPTIIEADTERNDKE
jgi:hypothetical protein